jgi:hypothetical protein
VLVQSLAPLHRADGCRDAGEGWYYGHRGSAFEHSAVCGRDAEYQRRCSHTNTGAGAARFVEKRGAGEVLVTTIRQTAKFTSQA